MVQTLVEKIGLKIIQGELQNAILGKIGVQL